MSRMPKTIPMNVNEPIDPNSDVPDWSGSGAIAAAVKWTGMSVVSRCDPLSAMTVSFAVPLQSAGMER